MVKQQEREDILDALADMQLAKQRPVLALENDNFAARLLKAELTIEAAGLKDLEGSLKVPTKIVDLVLEKRLAEWSDCDSMTLGPTAGKEAQDFVNSKIENIRSQLENLSSEHNLSIELLDQLGIS